MPIDRWTRRCCRRRLAVTAVVVTCVGLIGTTNDFEIGVGKVHADWAVDPIQSE